MKAILETSSQVVLRFDKDEEVFAGIVEYCKQKNIKAGYFSGIGSSSKAELGYYNQFLKEYRRKPYLEDMEIVSLSGNVAMLGDVPAVHAHGIFGKTDFTLLGGHVFSIIALATCEIYLSLIEGEMKRENNPDFNLNLLA